MNDKMEYKLVLFISKDFGLRYNFEFCRLLVLYCKIFWYVVFLFYIIYVYIKFNNNIGL